MTVLFVTRKYPPQTGGMENFCYGLINNYQGQKYAVTYGGKQKWLPFIYPILFLRSWLVCVTKKVDIIHLGDGVMTPMGYLLKLLTGKKIVLTAHGKDINFQFSLYRKMMPFFFKKVDHFYCVSNNTIEECIKVGIPRKKCTFIPNGVKADDFIVPEKPMILKKKLAKKYNLKFKGKKILITVGRLSKRKGVLWFVKNVAPKLSDEYIYIIIGADNTEVNDLKSWLGYKSISYGQKLKKMINGLDLKKKVFWLGRISFDDLKAFYNIADLFVMPNISVPGDVEGFGIVIIEATSTGLPVVGSGIEGIKDAVIDGRTGKLVESENVKQFLSAIDEWSLDSKSKRVKIKDATKKSFSWRSVADMYQKAFEKVLQ